MRAHATAHPPFRETISVKIRLARPYWIYFDFDVHLRAPPSPKFFVLGGFERVFTRNLHVWTRIQCIPVTRSLLLLHAVTSCTGRPTAPHKGLETRRKYTRIQLYP